MRNFRRGGETDDDGALYEKNARLIGNSLYNLQLIRRYIINAQFVTPDAQYRMTEPNGYLRGGIIRNLDSFYESDFYLLPQEQKGYPVWMDGAAQTQIFYKNEQSFYGMAGIITMGISVYEPKTREFLGILLLNIDLKAFSGAMAGYEAYSDGNLFLVGTDGVLTWSNPSLLAPPFPQNQELYQEMLVNRQDITRRTIDGQNILLAYENIPGTPMFASYVADLDVLLKHTYEIRNLCILVLICIVIACFIISYYVTNSISSPILALVHAMQKAGDGKWTTRCKDSGHDEIALLGERFNEMADKTDQLIEEVYLSEIKRQRMLLGWKNAQLDAMLMQINPHFLYNTLDIIRWEAMYEANGESPVTQMIEKFSRLCRMGMRTGSNTVRLSEGIEHASTYLDVINFRHSHKIQLLIETEVDADALYIPQFMLQPIMENAIIHAFGDASQGYRIRIRSYCQDDTLFLLVEDNGKGMTDEELTSLRQALLLADISDKSIGLVNVNQRIRLFYGEDYGIHIDSHAGRGTVIQITLPVRSHSENMERNEEVQKNDLSGIDRR